MYTVELDLHLRFVPPMSEHGRPILLTRTITLPFPPFKGLCVFSKHIDECPEPEGLSLRDVLWDMDRSVFLATTAMSDHGCPFQQIPEAILGWISRGWKLGSNRDRYVPAEPDETDGDTVSLDDGPEYPDDLHKVPFRKRPKEFNRVFKAMIRQLAESFELDVAYAMDETGMFFEETVLWDSSKATPDERKFRDLKHAFRQLPDDEQLAWRERVIRYRSLESVVRRFAFGSTPPR